MQNEKVRVIKKKNRILEGRIELPSVTITNPTTINQLKKIGEDASIEGIIHRKSTKKKEQYSVFIKIGEVVYETALFTKVENIQQFLLQRLLENALYKDTITESDLDFIPS